MSEVCDDMESFCEVTIGNEDLVIYARDNPNQWIQISTDHCWGLSDRR